jgi:hypothetical protein
MYIDHGNNYKFNFTHNGIKTTIFSRPEDTLDAPRHGNLRCFQGPIDVPSDHKAQGYFTQYPPPPQKKACLMVWKTQDLINSTKAAAVVDKAVLSDADGI